ncbi:MAG TPA: hypothetical protein VMD09_12735 [Solirubrobacteraceae bacterium]|nr:hypothetical protein [Solirubrobacteraceae bacterium]
MRKRTAALFGALALLAAAPAAAAVRGYHPLLTTAVARRAIIRYWESPPGGFQVRVGHCHHTSLRRVICADALHLEADDLTSHKSIIQWSPGRAAVLLKGHRVVVRQLVIGITVHLARDAG